MEKFTSILMLLVLAASAFAQSAQEYSKIGFVDGNVSINASAVYAMGEENSSYAREGERTYFRSDFDNEKITSITSNTTPIVEMQTTDPQKAGAELDYLAQNGILLNYGESEKAQIMGALDRMQMFSVDTVGQSTQCCMVERIIAPPTKQEALLTDLTIPPLTLQSAAPMLGAGIAASGMALPTEKAAPAPDASGAGAALPSAKELPAPADLPSGAPAPTMAIRSGAQPDAYAAQDTGAQGWQADPQEQGRTLDLPNIFTIVAGIILLAFAALFVFRPTTMTVQEETPEVQMAMSNETRMAIMRDLAEAERIPTDLSNRIGKSKATISEHLEQLVGVGLVEKVQTEGRKFVYYRLSQKGRTVLLRRKMAG